MSKIRTTDVYVQRTIRQVTCIRVTHLAGESPHEVALERAVDIAGQELDSDEWDDVSSHELPELMIHHVDACEVDPKLLASEEFLNGPFSEAGETAEAAVLVQNLMDIGGDLTALCKVARLYQNHPVIGARLKEFKEALLGD
jgi:hypothetical protein